VPAQRSASRHRQTKETDVSVRLNLDGGGAAEIATGVPFLDHLLRALAVHGRLDLEVTARGDLDVDAHHTVEDVALVLGETLAEATFKALARALRQACTVDAALGGLIPSTK